MNRFCASSFLSTSSLFLPLSFRTSSTLSPIQSTPFSLSSRHPRQTPLQKNLQPCPSSFFSTCSFLQQQQQQQQNHNFSHQQQKRKQKYPTPAPPPKRIDSSYTKMLGLVLCGALLWAYKRYESTFAFHLINQEDFDDPPLPPTNLKPSKFAFLDLQMGSEPPSRIVIGVYADHVPKTSHNFTQLAKGCEAGHYKNTSFHKTQKGFLIQGGDVENMGGYGGQSVYGKTFKDEITGMGMTHKKGRVTMANYGRNTNSSQFAICAEDCYWMDRKHVVFGEVVEGMDVVEKISNLEVDEDNHPLVPCVIVASGVLPNYVQQQQQQ